MQRHQVQAEGDVLAVAPATGKDGEWGKGKLCTAGSSAGLAGSEEKCFPLNRARSLDIPAGPPQDLCTVKAVLADRVVLEFTSDKHRVRPSLEELRDDLALQPDRTSTEA